MVPAALDPEGAFFVGVKIDRRRGIGEGRYAAAGDARP